MGKAKKNGFLDYTIEYVPGSYQGWILPIVDL